jgi:lysozyme family protein
MTTKFMGVRMSNVCTRIARDESVRARNNQSGTGEANGKNPEIEEKLAGVDNDCPYKEYPLDDTGTPEDLAKIIKKAEGGYVGNVDGKICTMKGVTLETYRQFYGSNKTCNDLKNITDEEWNNIFKKGYWDKWRADEIKNKSIANLLVDWLYNSGPKHGIGKPQEVLGLPQTYKVTDKEISAINNYPDQRELFQKFWNRRKLFFETIAKGNKAKFLKGWLNRLNEFKYSDTAPRITKNNEGKVSSLANGFLHALNQTSKSSSENVEIGIDINKSSGDTIWLTNSKNSNNFGSVFDMILNTYSNKVSNVTWIIPKGGDQSSVPTAYLVTVKEGSNIVNVKVADEKSPNSSVDKVHVSKGEDTSGIHKSFCKALVKKYKSHTSELEKDTNNKLDDYDALFNDDKYKIQSCNEVKAEAGITEGQTGGIENETGYIGDWNVGKYVQMLHKYQSSICEDKGKSRHSYGGCGVCTGVINRALRDSGFGMKYWATYPWDVYTKLKSGDDFVEVRSASSVTNKTEFSLGTVNKGDICLMWRTDKKANYHTCSFDGSKWYSDFIQNSCNVYRSGAACNMEWHLMRHK